MENTNKEQEEILKERLQTLERNLEDLEENIKKIWQEEDEEDIQITRSSTMLDQMSASCSPEDRIIQLLIEENQETLRTLRKRKIEFADEYQMKIKKERKRLECEMEEVYVQISSLKKENG